MPQPPDRVEIRPAGPADAEALVDYMTALVAERLERCWWKWNQFGR